MLSLRLWVLFSYVDCSGCVGGAIADYEEEKISYTFSRPGEYIISLKMKTPIDSKENETTITIQEEIK